MSEKRFIEVYTQGVMTVIKIVIDTETGVQYLWYNSGYAGGLTPLLDSEGKPVVRQIPPVEQDWN
jgi:hypothetical protein